MYFWNIDGLKRDLESARLSERESLKYVLWWCGASWVADSLPLGYLNVWDYVDAAITLIAVIFGTLYVYYRNGGSSGRDFLTRYVSLGWVFAIRFAVLVLIPVIVAGIVVESLLAGGLPEPTAPSPEPGTPLVSAVLAALQFAFYVRLGHHFAKLGSPSGAA